MTVTFPTGPAKSLELMLQEAFQNNQMLTKLFPAAGKWKPFAQMVANHANGMQEVGASVLLDYLTLCASERSCISRGPFAHWFVDE